MTQIVEQVRQMKRIAGRKGGKTTFEKYGRDHMQFIGRAGADVMHMRYKLEPIGQNDFALVHRKTGVIKARLSGLPVE